MQLAKKKNLASKVLNTGKNRIIFSQENLNEIKEAITRQDISDLYKAGAIKIKEIKGRKKRKKRKNRRGPGKIKKKVKNSKQEYVKLTRKLRKYAKFLLNMKRIDKEKYRKIRRMIKASRFKSKKHLDENLKEI